uniref:Apoptosis and caspase activation inhibitor n=1 Tax=Chelonoidis abingdonii TaxID=106734 RepID=A0A8C0J844_CHEAB
GHGYTGALQRCNFRAQGCEKNTPPERCKIQGLNESNIKKLMCIYVDIAGFYSSGLNEFTFIVWKLWGMPVALFKIKVAFYFPSTGDSFTQFRFAEEKEWDTGSVGPKQLSALYVDCQSLVQALQELPLHLRLNVAAEMVQASTPTELPQIKSKSIEDSKRRVTQLQPPLGQSGIASICDPVSDSVVHLMPLSKDGPETNSSESFQRGCSVSQQEADNLDEELDLLLNLDAPVHVENNFLSETYNTTAESDLKMKNGEIYIFNPFLVCIVLSILDVAEETSSAAEEQKTTAKNITEEELEDWLDSMIS